jgi:hypothetical protein
MTAKGSSRTDRNFPRASETIVSDAPGARQSPKEPRIRWNSRFFLARLDIFVRQIHSFFALGPRERLRSLGETASYGSNSAVDSPGAAMGAL